MPKIAEVSDQSPIQRFKRVAVFANPASGGGKVVRLLPRIAILRVLPRLILTGILELPDLQVFRASKVRVETDPPAMFQGDGELLGLTPVEIEVLPAAVAFLAPSPSDD
jgi:diacylglycerol kinase family enzyme